MINVNRLVDRQIRRRTLQRHKDLLNSLGSRDIPIYRFPVLEVARTLGKFKSEFVPIDKISAPRVLRIR